VCERIVIFIFLILKSLKVHKIADSAMLHWLSGVNISSLLH
jgi:hypothetical protein